MRTDMLPLVILGLCVLSMVVYSLSRGSRSQDPGDTARGGFALGLFARRWFYWLIRPLEKFLLKAAPWPTAFNVAGAVLGVAAGVGFALGMVTTGGWCILLGGTADVFDGRIARAQGLDSRRGAFLDSTLDRFAEVGAFVGLSVLFLDSPWLTAVVALALGGSLLVSYARARGESVGVVCKQGVMQRAERILALGLGAVLDPFVTSAAGWHPNTVLAGTLVVIAGGTVGTALFRTVWIAARLPSTNSGGF